MREFLKLRLLPFQLLLEWPDARRGQGWVRDPQWDPLLQIPAKLVVGVLNVQRHAVKMSRKKGWPSAGPVLGARIFLMSSSRSSGKGCDPSPNESDSWSLSPHGEVRTQILAPSAAALDSGRVHGANRPTPPSLKGRCLKAIWRYMTLSERLGSCVIGRMVGRSEISMA